MRLVDDPQEPAIVDLDKDIASVPYTRVCSVCGPRMAYNMAYTVTFSCFPSMMRHWQLEHPNEAPKSESAHDNGNVWKLQPLDGMVHHIPLWLELADEEDIARWIHSQQVNWNHSAALWRELKLPDLDREELGERVTHD